MKPIIAAPEEVIDKITQMIAAMPELAEALPAGCQSREFWREIFGRNQQTRRRLEAFQEMPAFTEQAPSHPSQWPEVFAKDYPGKLAPKLPEALITLQDVITVANAQPRESAGKRWRDAWSPDQTVQRVRPRESNQYIPNPHRGTTTFQRFQGDPLYATWPWSDTHGPLDFDFPAPTSENIKYIPYTTLTYCRWPWSYLEPKKGKYNWKIVDSTLKAARLRGQTVQIRFQPYTMQLDYSKWRCTARRRPPKTGVDVPDWYWDTGAKWIDKGAHGVNEVDSNDPRYLKHFGEFVRAFARRYDGHPDLESVDIAYAGFWGESGGNCTPQTARKLVDIYLKGFAKTQLVSMLGTEGCRYAQSKTGHPRPRPRHPAGWRADSFGDLHKRFNAGVPPHLCWNHTFDLYPKQIQQDGVKDAWMHAPVTMETSGNVATWFMNDLDLDVIFREGFRYHMSVFMPKSGYFPQKYLPALIEFDKRIGYRFVVRQILMPLQTAREKKLHLEFFIDNVGCAPIYPAVHAGDALPPGPHQPDRSLPAGHPHVDARAQMVPRGHHRAPRPERRARPKSNWSSWDEKEQTQGVVCRRGRKGGWMAAHDQHRLDVSWTCPTATSRCILRSRSSR